MRLLVFFDLPMLTDKDRHSYQEFRRFLLKDGFIMMQKSVYSKLAVNRTVLDSVKCSVRKHLPPDGLVEMLEVTEKQYNKIEYLLGRAQSRVIDSDERVVIL